ncbi:MAG: relaxase domain-containing protein [Micrococcales bacterium]|nr:relaxase domain-containing protein [Micrococcales bacterium]
MRLMSAGDGYKYLLTSVAAGDGDRSLSTPLTRYYDEAGCPPGRWMGSGVTSLGDQMLSEGEIVTEAQLELLIGQGRHPVTGEPLGRAYPQYASVSERVDQRARALDPALSGAERAQALVEIEQDETRRGTRRAVAGFDYTFSVPKSVSVLWGVADAGTQALIAQAHHDAVADVVGFMEREVVATRTGVEARDGSIVQADVTGIVATGFDHYDSRAGDPQLHTHVVVANKVCAAHDGKWRSVDSRPMHSAVVTLSALYNAVLADRMTRVLGVDWDARERGRDRNPAWEITGVGDDLIGMFSTRAGDIDQETDRRIAAYVAEHGRRPSRRMILQLRQQATLATRPDKQIRSLADLTAEWRQRASSQLDEDATSWARRVIAQSESVVVRADDIPVDMIDALALSVLATVGERRSTWRRWNLHAEASRQTMGWRFASTGDRVALTELICDAAEHQSLRLTPAEMSAPDQFRRPDGSSRFRPKHMTVYSSQDLFDAETRLAELTEVLTGPVVPYATIHRVAAQPDSHGRMLGPDQVDALTWITTSGRMLDVLVGPAGAGKTTALTSLRTAWETEHGPGSVIGLAPSATAAAVLGEDLGIPTENTARWLALHDHTGVDYQPGQLVIIDEASLAGTFTLDRITSLANQAGAKVVLVGDWAQLQAVDAGGAFTMLVANRRDAPELTDIHRFTNEWEKTASLALRHADPAALDQYETHGRLIDGDLDQVTQLAYEAWRDDTTQGVASLLVADALTTVQELNRQARHDRILAGQVDPQRELEVNDGSRVSTGDTVITRQNNRHLIAGRTGWVRNGDRWTILKTHHDGAVTVRRAGYTRGASAILPADYVAEHLDLG